MPIVSILSQPEGRELQGKTFYNTNLKTFQSSPSPKAGSYIHPAEQILRVLEVSILSQPEGRELLANDANRIQRRLFQSSPSPKAGSYFLRLQLLL